MKDYTIKRIRKMRFERDMGVEQIAAKTGYCTNTIYKYLKDNFESPEEKEQKEYIGIAAPYEPIIREWLTEDKKHFYKQRHTAKRVYDRLRKIEPSLSISYKTVLRMYNRIHREVFSDRRERLNLPNSPGVAEIICTATKLRINKKNCNSHVITLSFPYSRAAYIQVIPDCNSEWVLTAIQNIYEHIGGVPPVQLFTPQTTLYKYRVHDIASLEDELFQRFILYYDFKDNYFIPSKEDELRLSGHSLGSYYRKQIMDGVKNIDDLAAFNKELLIKCDALGSRSTTLDKTKTVNELFDADKNKLLPLPEIPFKIITWFKRKVDNMAMLTIGGNHKYALSPGMKCRTVFVFLTTDKVEVRNLNKI